MQKKKLCKIKMYYKKIKKLLFKCFNRKKRSKLLLLKKYFKQPKFQTNKKENQNKMIEKIEFYEPEINEEKPRFLIDVNEYETDKILLVGRSDKKLLVKITTKKLEYHHYKKSNKEYDIESIDNNIKKYFYDRYLLFSKFDENILLDYESWFSVTPEPIAEDTAKRVKKDSIILDAFCGVGGNSIQVKIFVLFYFIYNIFNKFAKYCNFVIANDIDQLKIEYAKNNSSIYGVSEKIKFINQDFLTLDYNEQIDIVFLAPPWGGIDYSTNKNYSLYKNITPNIINIMDKAFSLSQKIVLALPRNINIEELIEIIVDSSKRCSIKPDRAVLEIEKIYLNNRFKMIMVYFGNAGKVLYIIKKSYVNNYFFLISYNTLLNLVMFIKF